MFTPMGFHVKKSEGEKNQKYKIKKYIVWRYGLMVELLINLATFPETLALLHLIVSEKTRFMTPDDDGRRMTASW